jgi:hypothetical protein
VRPERRRRGDLVAAAVLVLALVAGGVALWRVGAAAGTSSVTAEVPVAAPAEPVAVPVAFREAWRAPSDATPAPVTVGPAAVTADGSAVVGRDAGTGAERWSYTRDLPLCTVGGGFPAADGGLGRVLALYRNGEYCSELTALRPDTGARVAQRNPDSRPGVALLGDGSLVALADRQHVEVLRTDLVRTLEFGEVPAPEQPGQQPRNGCSFGSFAFTSERLGLIERCPGEATDRLTVVSPDGADGAEQPEEQFSIPLPAAGATLVALSSDRAAVALPGPPRLQILDRAGLEVGLVELDVPAADVSGGTATTTSDGRRVYWWTGTRTVALDATALTPLWTLPGTLGPGVRYADALLVPVPDGLLEVDPARGVALRTLAVARPDRDAPVRLGALGEVLLEQRGPELVALRPEP